MFLLMNYLFKKKQTVWLHHTWRINPIDIDNWLKQAIPSLENSKCETPSLEAQVLLSHFLNKSRTWVIAHPEYVIPTQQLADLNNSLQSLIKGTPLPYLVNNQDFFGLPFFTTPNTLIPRPETELLVEKGLQWINSLPEPESSNIIDIGTGTGCIAITLAKSNPAYKIIATDISRKALEVAQKNSLRNNVENQIFFIQCDLLPPVDQTFSLICANLPYIPSTTLSTLKVANYEPIIALDGGKDGLVYIEKLLQKCKNHVQKNSLLLLEIEANQANRVIQLAHQYIPNCQANVIKDLAGKDRLIEIEVL